LSETVLAIDIGSTKICAIIAEVSDAGVQIEGHGVSKAQGIKKGAITNIDLASKSIKKAVDDAKRIAGSNISSATVSISSSYAKSLSSTGVVNIPQKEISIKEISRLMQTALYNAKVPSEYEVIHVLPYNFRVDEQDMIEDPFGMNASRMEVDVNIIMTQKSNLTNLKKAIRSAGVEIEGVVLSGYASAISAMNADERELGVAVIDLGGQTSSLVIHAGNSIRYIDFLGVGSNHITNDLSMALHTPLQVAEDVKVRYGNLIETSNEVIELPIIGDEENKNGVSLDIVHNVIFSRVEEALTLLAKSLEKSNLKDQLGAGVILTGGMTQIKGIRELAQSVFPAMPIRIASPNNIDGLFDELKNPAFSTVIGLLKYKAGEHTQYEIDFQEELLHTKGEIQDENDITDIDMRNALDREENKKRKKKKTTNDHIEPIDFDSLPKLEGDSNSWFNKMLNWIKQLF